MIRVPVSPKLIRWARERSGLGEAALAKRFSDLSRWESGESQPTFHQLEDFGRATLTPFGAFFLSEPPVDRLPVPDFRTLRDKRLRRASAALLETIFQMQRRQEWMREFLIEQGTEPLSFIGTLTAEAHPVSTAERIRVALGIENGWAAKVDTWTDAVLALRKAVEDAGVMVVINGIFENNTHQKLDPDEFRGFVLSDTYAPLIFINGSDFKAAQMFTMAHELAHLWLGENGIHDLPALQPSEYGVERFCNATAAEFLIPASELRAYWPTARERQNPYDAMSRHFKVSPMVAARRVLDEGMISKTAFKRFLKVYEADERQRNAAKPAGGDFYKTQILRVGHRFGSAVVTAVRSGKLLYTDAYRLTGLTSSTFDQFASKLGF